MGDPIQTAISWAKMIPLLSQPVRELSDDDAFDLMMDLVDTGDIKLFDKVVMDKSGNITSHRPGMQTRIVPEIAGVPFLQGV